MRPIRAFLGRVAGLFDRTKADSQLADELAAHLQLHTDDNVRAGMSLDEARRVALLKLGGLEQIKEQYRDRRGLPALDNLSQDVRYGVRTLRKNPGFAAIAVLVLACGIGVNTAVFTVINALMLRPLEGARSGDLISLYSRDADRPDRYHAFSYPDYRDLRAAQSLFADLAAHRLVFVGLTEGQIGRQVMADFVSANYFDVLGTTMIRGRAFTPADEAADAPAAIVGYTYWKRKAFDPDLLGKRIRVNTVDVPIVGILPEGFTGTTAIVAPELWLSLAAWDTTVATAGRNHLETRENYTLQPFGHLRAGLSTTATAAPLQVLARDLRTAFPGPDRNQVFLVEPSPRLTDSVVPHPETEFTAFSLALMGLSSIVLLIACLNVSNLLLARGLARRHEIAVRVTVGASRFRIVRQLLVEDFLLASLGGAVGLLVSYQALSVLISSIESAGRWVVLSFHIAPDVRVLLATATFCSLCTLLFGLGPALRAGRVDVLPELKNHTGEEGRQRLLDGRNLLVIGQLALSMALVTFGGLFVRAAWRAGDATPGYPLGGQLVVSFDMAMAGYDEARGAARYRELLDRVRSLPQVEAAALASQVAFSDFTENHPLTRGDGTEPLSAIYTVVGPDYFSTLRLPMQAGRDFTRLEHDGARRPHVAIVDDALAARLWPQADPIGQHVRVQAFEATAGALIGTGEWLSLEVVGIVPGVRHELTDPGPVPHVYVPLAEQYRAAMHLQLRVASGSESTTLKAIREVVRRLDDRLPIVGMGTFAEQRNASVNLWAIRSGGRLFTLFGIVALGVAVLGVYGVKSYSVARRTREIAIRIALGATPRDVLLLVLRHGAILAFTGLGIGLLLSVALALALSSWLIDVKALDPAVFGLAGLTLAVTSLVAAYVPSRRVLKIAPLMALRRE